MKMIEESSSANESVAPLPQLTGDVPSVVANDHKVWLATLLGFFITGAGQFYNRQTGKGIALLVTKIALFTLLRLAHANNGLDGIFQLVFSLAAIVDARMIAIKIRAGKTVGKWEFF